MAVVTESGTFTGNTDLITKLHVFALANGFTANRFVAVGNGYGLCIEKSGVFLNYRTLDNEQVSQGIGPYWTGIAGNQSTSFDSGLATMFQPGAPTYNSADAGGFMNSDTSIPSHYRFVLDEYYLSLTVEDVYGEYQHIVQAYAPNMVGVFSSGNFNRYANDDRAVRRSFLRVVDTAYTWLYGNAIRRGASWRRLSADRVFDDYVYNTMPFFDFAQFSSDPVGLITPPLLDNSVNANIPLPPLLPFSVAVCNSIPFVIEQYDGVDGIKILNIKHIASGSVITVGGSDYAVYKANYDQANYGIAFRIS